MRLRDLGISLGRYAPGPFNAITDVAGVRVGFTTLVAGDGPNAVRTGVTAVLPSETILHEHLFAGAFSFNGCGEITGLEWIAESGLLTSPVGLTNTHSVGAVHEAIIRYASLHSMIELFLLPVVGETCDAYLNDMNGLHVRPEHAIAAFESASDGPLAEGNVGGGTGMVCHEFKGGTGTASRRFETGGQAYTVGALVQANYGDRDLLRVDGVPVGSAIDRTRYPGYDEEPAADGSIIVLLATDAPLLPIQCQRLAKRATVGLARVGGIGHNGSGDIFLAWSTANRLPPQEGEPRAASLHEVRMLAHNALNPLFEATAEAVEEAILNVLVAAETMIGRDGHTIYALPHEELLAIMRRAGRLT
jgi:D-aminopeptidase